RNAIPRESFAIVTVPGKNEKDFLACVKEMEAVYKKELATIDPDLKFEAVQTDKPAGLIDENTQQRLFNSVFACPNGVIRMSNDMKGLVETSTNLAIIKSENGEIAIQCLLRSSVDSAKEDLKNMFTSVFELAGNSNYSK
ncbi:unnamed protein product, partial [marine sediment metagenome]